jgi:phage protein D/phage baseplate assembly protein gpV
MANESFANTLVVELDGAALAADVMSLLTQAYVDDSVHLPDLCVLRFRDPEQLVLAKGKFKIGSVLTVKVQTAEPGPPQPLMIGEVTALEVDIDPAGTFTEVRALDRAHRLFRGRRVAAYPNMTVPDVVRKVTDRAGLKPGRIEAGAGAGGQSDAQLSQDNVSDWEFLSRLAYLVGARLTVVDSTLDFRVPDPPTGAPPTTVAATRDPLVLEVNRNLVSLRACLSAAEQVPEVEARGWNADQKQELTATAVPRVPGTEVAGLDPVAMSRTFASPPLLAAGAAYHNHGEVKAAAQALADQIGGACAELDGVAKGNPKLRAGTAVTLAGLGEPFAGKYTLTSTRHQFGDQAGYTTAFTVSGRQERSLYGLVAGGTEATTPRVTGGLVPAIVSDVRDPLKSGRVRVTLPWLSKDFTSGWARTVHTGAGRDRGVFVLPEVGDEVLVGFSGGDLDTPYVLGGLYNGKDTPPALAAPVIDDASGEIGVRAMVSRTGHRLELVDSPRGDAVLLSTGTGKLLLKLDGAKNTVELTSAGPVKISGMGVTVDAGAGLLDLKGAQVKIAGQTTAELTAGGALTVRGGIVRIN